MQYCASISYGKDSLAMLHVIVDILHKPLDRIITAEVWATDTIQADLPPMVKFKEKADRIIKDRWGIEVEHFYATDKDGNKLTYEKMFYHIPKRRPPKMMGGGGKPGKKHGTIMGWPFLRGPWCNSDLKRAALQRMAHAKGAVVQQTEGAICKKNGSPDGGAVKNAVVDYIGIAADEPIRIERHQGKPGKEMPLVEAGWTEQMCWKWCEENGLLSPLYAAANRGGAGFAIISPLTNCGSCGGITRNFGL